MKNLLRFPLNIQLFADDGGNTGASGSDTTGGDSSSQSTQIDVTQSKEYLKLKASFDKTASELAGYKKQEKEKLPEMEQIKASLGEKDKQIEDLRKEILTSKMRNEFVGCGFEEKEIDELIKNYGTEDSMAFIKSISAMIKSLVEKTRASAKEEFGRSATVPPTGSTNKGVDPFMQQLIDKKNQKDKVAKSARELYLGKK